MKPPKNAELKMNAMPADVRDCKAMLAALRAQGLTPEWAARAEEKIAEHERREFLRKHGKGGAK